MGKLDCKGKRWFALLFTGIYAKIVEALISVGKQEEKASYEFGR
ncbi:hypothetical protein ACTQWG_17475 [Blautia sp. HCP3S3_H10_1]